MEECEEAEKQKHLTLEGKIGARTTLKKESVCVGSDVRVRENVLLLLKCRCRGCGWREQSGKVLENSVRPEGDVFAERCTSSRTAQVSITVQNNLLIPDRGGTSQPSLSDAAPQLEPR